MGPHTPPAFRVRTAFALFLLVSAGCHRESDADKPVSKVTINATSKSSTPARAECMHDMQGSPEVAARLALRSGDSRVYIIDQNGYTAHWRVPGIEPTTKRECSPDVATVEHDAFVHSKLLEGLASPGPAMMDMEPIFSKCGISRLNWARAFNRELARLTPRSVAKVCGPFKLSVHDLGDLPSELYASYAQVKGS